MILLCDEDIGTGVPRALSAVGYQTRSLVGLGWQSESDVVWLERAGQAGWLVLSSRSRCRYRLFDDRLGEPAERASIVAETVGCSRTARFDRTSAIRSVPFSQRPNGVNISRPQPLVAHLFTSKCSLSSTPKTSVRARVASRSAKQLAEPGSRVVLSKPEC